MGKTALLAYAVEQASDMTVLTVTGVEGESDLAFGGLHGLLSPVVDALGGVPEAQREALAAALGLAAGEGRDRLLVSAGVLSLLAAAAEPKPILCLVDDAQWLDSPSANALSFTARRLVAEDVVILFGARDGELRRFEAAGLEELELGGLERDVAAMLLDQVAREAAPSVRGRLLDEAAGNPLALLELPAGLSDAQLAGHAQVARDAAGDRQIAGCVRATNRAIARADPRRVANRGCGGGGRAGGHSPRGGGAGAAGGRIPSCRGSGLGAPG